jgi:glycerol uptake facilitator-like aquaporin
MQKHSWWQRLHWPEYGSELLGTAFLVFIAVSAVTFNLGLGSPLAVVLPKSSTRRLITGLLLAGSGPLVAISPLGKLSGAHLNPAVSLAFWLQGKMHQHDLVGYLASQLLGAALGAGLVVLIWRERAASVHNGVTAPGVGYPIWSVFLLEMGLSCLLVLAGCAHLWFQPESRSQLWPCTGLLVLARPVGVFSCFSHRGAACRRPLSLAEHSGHTRCADRQNVPRSALPVHL